MTIFTNLIAIVKDSTDPGSKFSSSRVQAYFVLVTTILYSFTFVIIEISNASMSLMQGIPYAPSNESIVVLGMLLSHHIALMFSKKSDSPSIITPIGLHSTSSTTTTSSTSSTMPEIITAEAVMLAANTTAVKPTTSEDESLADQI